MILLSPRRRLRQLLVVTAVAACFIYYRRKLSVNQWRTRHQISWYSFNPEATNPQNVDRTTGLMKPDRAVPFCEAHNWKIYPNREAPRKIYDMFMVNAELDWLDIRLHTLKDVVDYFVIVEASKTFTGMEKPLHVSDKWKDYKAFHSKIIYRIFDDSDFNFTKPGDREDSQRNALFDQVIPELHGKQKAEFGDVIIVSNIDELPRPATLNVLRNCAFPRRLTLRSAFYSFGFQWLQSGEEWAHPQATYYEGNSTLRPTNLRNGDGGNPLTYPLEARDLWNSGWYCSFCFRRIESVLHKISSLPDQSFNKPEFRVKSWIASCARNGLDPFGRKGLSYNKIEGNSDLPEHIARHPTAFTYLLDRGPPNANFKDYDPLEAQADVIQLANAKPGRG